MDEQDFESTTSTNSITPAGVGFIIHDFPGDGKGKMRAGHAGAGKKYLLPGGKRAIMGVSQIPSGEAPPGLAAPQPGRKGV